jgi:hypothetical protein
MDLKTANDKMILVMEELEVLIPKLEKLETEYYSTYYTKLLHALERTEGQREASSKLQLAQESIAEKYLDLKYKVRVLLTKKEMLIEICRNLRVLEH